MDYFSNEFLRIENFIEKYMPLKIQNQISDTLKNSLQAKEKWKLKVFEDSKFMELRECLIEDRGLPCLAEEVHGIIQKAKEISNKFHGYEREPSEV